MEKTEIEALIKEHSKHNKSGVKAKGWLSDNIVSLIAICILLFTLVVYLLVLTHTIKTAESTTITILANVSNFLMLVLGFYFGSSKGSKEKDKQITELTVAAEDKK